MRILNVFVHNLYNKIVLNLTIGKPIPTKMGIAKKSQENQEFGLDSVPAFSPVVMALLKRLQRGDVARKELQSLLEADPKISASLLRLANSSYYAIRGGVGSVEKALALLGTETVYQLVLMVGLSSVFKGKNIARPPDDVYSFWKRSLSMAIWSKILWGKIRTLPKSSKVSSDIDTHGLFTLGMLAFLGEWFAKSQDRNETFKTTSVLLREWNFPKWMIETLEDAGASEKNDHPLNLVYLTLLESIHKFECADPKDSYWKLFTSDWDGMEGLLRELV